jgi:hypothetical protein
LGVPFFWVTGCAIAIREEHLDRVALVRAVATSIRVKVAAQFERIELRVGDVDRQATDAPALPPVFIRFRGLFSSLDLFLHPFERGDRFTTPLRVGCNDVQRDVSILHKVAVFEMDTGN